MTAEAGRKLREALALPPGARAKECKILAACSGGADSVALLHLLWEAKGAGVVCAHFNHKLRGAESDGDEAFVREMCAQWQIPFVRGDGDVAGYARRNGLGIEEAARALRYRFLRQAAADRGCAYVATAHNAEDNAETVLLNLLRGAGARGLAGIPPERELGGGIRLIRPLLGVSRGDILSYLRENRLDHREDSSNAGEEYTRNRLRHRVVPLLRELNPEAVEHICSAAGLLREDEDYLDGLAAEFVRERCGGGAVPVEALAALPRPIAMRALRRLAGSPGRAHLDRLYAFCLSGRERWALSLPGGQARKDGKTLTFGPSLPSPAALPRRVLPEGVAVPLPEIGKAARWKRESPGGGQEIYSSFNTFIFQSEKICGKISVASREAGDEIRLAGRGCTKQVRRLFQERGLSPEERMAVPVFSDEQGVIAVAGFGVAERCAAAPGKAAVRLELLDLPSDGYGPEDMGKL